MDTVLPTDLQAQASSSTDMSVQLEQLYKEHRDLDAMIEQLSTATAFDHLQLRRLKKRKLMLRDVIKHYESLLIPDIIA